MFYVSKLYPTLQREIMKKLPLIISLIFYVSLTNTYSQTKGLIWEIADGDSKAYLLGSIHVGKEDLYPLPDVIENAFKQSECIYVEINAADVNPFEMAKHMMLPDTLTLEGLLSPKKYQLIQEEFAKLGMGKFVFNKLKPWAAALTLMQMQLQASEYMPQFGIDFHFINRAKELNKPIYELESFEFQVEIFDRISDNPDSLIDYLLNDISYTDKKIDELFEFWINGDEQKLNEYIESEYSQIYGSEKIREILEFERNRNMAAKIENVLKNNQNCFIIIGAAHLVGSKGIISILREKGKYKIRKL